MEAITNKRPTRSRFTVAATWMTAIALTRRQRSMAHRFTTHRRVITHRPAITRRHAITHHLGITHRPLVITVRVRVTADAPVTAAATGMAAQVAITGAAMAIVRHLPALDLAAAGRGRAGMVITEGVAPARAGHREATSSAAAASVAAATTAKAAAIAENRP